LENQRLISQDNQSVNQLNQFKEDVNEIEQYIRRDCLEIRGVPVLDDEDTGELVRKVIDVDIEETDISVSHRLPINRSY
jgi:hypothetical protein